MPMVYLGIDPGLTGAVATIGESGAIRFHDTPVFKDGKRTRIDIAAGLSLLQDILFYAAGCSVCAAIEKSQPMPGNGSIAAFSLGYSYGVWCALLTALDIPWQPVSPVTWKKAMMPGEPKEKDASRIVAMRLFPLIREELNLKKHHGRADSLLIAEYGRRMNR